jgi:peptidyl-prolyl cis-trans isomerase SurA
MDDKVWSKAIEDTAGLKAFYTANQDKYKWDRRAEAIVISAANKDVLNQALAQMKTGRYEYRKNKPEPVKFASGKSVLTANDKTALDKVVTTLKNDSSLTAQITASAEAKEATGKNSGIAAARGKAISTYLTGKGIAANRITTKTGKGSRSSTIKLTSNSLSTLADNLNQTNALALQVTPARKYQRGDSKLVDEVKDWKPGVTQFEKDGRQVYVQILSIAEPAPKTLNEARGIVTSDYQAHLEKQWLEELKKKYPVQVNQAELQKLVKK